MVLLYCAAKAIQEMPSSERTAWAIESKEAANEVFRRGEFKIATDIYMEVYAHI